MLSPDWSLEPDLDALREAHNRLTTDPARALSDLEQLAARGSFMSMLYLAQGLSASANTQHDIAKARHWYLQAAERGSVKALHMFGRLSLDLKDTEGALRAFSDAAAREYAPSRYRLGKMYQAGTGVTKDSEKARLLLDQATSAGHLLAKRDLGVAYTRGEYGMAKIPHGIRLLASLVKDLIQLKSMEMTDIEKRLV